MPSKFVMLQVSTILLNVIIVVQQVREQETERADENDNRTYEHQSFDDRHLREFFVLYDGGFHRLPRIGLDDLSR
jgi:hypothetical protein